MVCVDLVGSFAIRTPTKTHSLLALTMIDPTSGWFEIVEATNKSATSIQDLFHNTWLALYPRPQFIVFYNGNMGEFKREFQQMCVLENYGIKAKPTKITTNHQLTSKFCICVSVSETSLTVSTIRKGDYHLYLSVSSDCR
jgi:hypothetical protein